MALDQVINNFQWREGLKLAIMHACGASVAIFAATTTAAVYFHHVPDQARFVESNERAAVALVTLVGLQAHSRMSRKLDGQVCDKGTIVASVHCTHFAFDSSINAAPWR